MLSGLAIGYLLGIGFTFLIAIVYGKPNKGGWAGPLLVVLWIIFVCVAIGIIGVEFAYDVLEPLFLD